MSPSRLIFSRFSIPQLPFLPNPHMFLHCGLSVLCCPCAFSHVSSIWIPHPTLVWPTNSQLLTQTQSHLLQEALSDLPAGFSSSFIPVVLCLPSAWHSSYFVNTDLLFVCLPQEQIEQGPLGILKYIYKFFDTPSYKKVEPSSPPLDLVTCF